MMKTPKLYSSRLLTVYVNISQNSEFVKGHEGLREPFSALFKRSAANEFPLFKRPSVARKQ